MKKYFLFLFLLCTVTIVAQTKEPITGFWGLSFGDSKYIVKEKLKKYDIIDAGDKIYIEDVTFAGGDYDMCSANFFRNKLFEGSFRRKNTSRDNATSFILDLKSKLDDKYGYGESDLDSSKDYVFYTWEDSKNRILLTLDKNDLTIFLIYTQTSLKKAKKQSELNDL